MIFFNNAVINKLNKVTYKNNRGQLNTFYSKDEQDISCNVQPITEKSKSVDWGESIDATYNIYLNSNICEVGDYILLNNKTYIVKEKIAWNNYDLIAIKEEKILWQNG